MAFDTSTRNRLASFVAAARGLIADEFTEQFQSLYGISATGDIAPLDRLSHLDEEGLGIAARLRERIDYLIKNHPHDRDGAKVAVARLAREQAFTVLNRLAAVRMAEKRGIIVESVGKGYQSKGFKVFETVAGSALGDTYHRYRCYLFCLFDELAVDLGVLFSRRSLQSLIFPRETALLELLGLLNAPALEDLWAEDETIGWIYQYYNDPTERKKMREESSAPRNSRELAVRNQFFTPRYVVEFLTDNTLGRIWYEMTQGQTRLKEQCRYLVRRPNEIFLTAIEPCYRAIYDKDAEVPPDIFDNDAYAALYKGDFKPAADGKDGFIALAAGVLATESIEAIIGEKWEQHGNECLDDLTRAIGQGLPHPRKDDLPWVWAALSQYVANSQIGSPYAKDTTRAFDELFRGLLRQHLDSSSSSQEDLLKQPVFIPHRPLKDPRTILMLDPACGSMHFGLYAFDLFEVIYDEAWALEEKLGADALSRPPGMKSLHATYAGKDAFLKDVPRLIIEHNLHGIDIDPRCAQIAGLSLWLRAQKAWQRLGLKPAERPAIKRSNIVCAEPMPGEKELLREFVEREFPAAERAVCLRLLEAIFDKMQLAGEAGSLLKIEEEIRSAIEDARAALQKLATKPSELFTTTELNQISTAPELTGLEQAVSSLTTDPRHLTTDFWERIEERIYAALRDYAEQAENGGGFQRRLFAEDAARGFSFIDVCRKRYDVALMNPPFGDTSDRVAGMLDNAVPIAKKNTYIASIVIGENRLASRGMLGAITDGSFIHQTRYEEFREFLLDGGARKLSCMTANGWGVLDSYVETASFVLNSSPDAAALFTDLRDCGDVRPEKLLTAIEAVATGSVTTESVFLLTAAFRRIPKSVLTFWLPTPILEAYRLLPSLAPALVDARCGLSSSDNPRFYKLRWEVPPVEISRDKKWVFLSNGGSPAPLFRQQFYVVNYERDGAEIKTRVKELFGSESRTVINQQYYFRAGFTYGKRTESLTVQFLPGGHVFSNEGQTIFPTEPGKTWHVMAYLNTSLVAFLLNSVAGQHKESGYVGSLPSPPKGFLEAEWVEGFMRENYQVLAGLAQAIPEAQSFSSLVNLWDLSRPAIFKLAAQRVSEASAEFSKRFARVDELLEASLGFSRDAALPWEHRSWDVPTILYDVSVEELESVIAHDCIGYAIGIIFGRWDIRYATGEQAAPELPDPFAPLPVCPPGQLQNAQGLPARPEDVPADYPQRISWPGILVDDENHLNKDGKTDDIAARIEDALKVIWKDRAEAIEQEACGILGVKTLRDYFRKPAGFFADHLKRYSKSRRQAPIYWPLSTVSGSYTLWIYYHRLTDQTLHTCLADFLDPKIRKVQADLDALNGQSGTRAGELREFRDELKNLHDEIERIIKLPWKPNLNDGVLITASPLHNLFRLPKWKKDLKACWDELAKGDYDWAHLAYSIWPQRVEKACERDRSLAIAHGLEHLCKVEPPKPKAKRATKKAAILKESNPDLPVND